MLDIFRKFKNGLIVSCQARENEPLFGSNLMAKMAFAAKWGGAHAIRANSPNDIRAIREVVDLPIIGLYKYTYPAFEPFITPTLVEARAIAEAGADIIAIDATSASRPGESLEELIAGIHSELNKPVLADVSTVEEGVTAQAYGADMVATTMRGYTRETKGAVIPDAQFVRELVSKVDCPVVAEGNIRTPAEAQRMIEAGAFAVVVGTAITRPQDITKWFVDAIDEAVQSAQGGRHQWG